jgi:hypothetical protein
VLKGFTNLKGFTELKVFTELKGFTELRENPGPGESSSSTTSPISARSSGAPCPRPAT